MKASLYSWQVSSDVIQYYYILGCKNNSKAIFSYKNFAEHSKGSSSSDKAIWQEYHFK